MTASGGALIVFEGSEGVGKTTQIRRLVSRLTASGIAVHAVREPGGTRVGDEIRRILLDPANDIVPRAEALLFMASRAELVERNIRPLLGAGSIVIADRFFLSTYAYQIVGRGLSENDVRSANAFATGGLVPDLTLLLDLSSAEGLSRASARGVPDRVEKSSSDFHARVGAAFSSFAEPAWQAAHPECGRIARIDASGTADEVGGRVAIAVERYLPETIPAGTLSSR